AGLEPKLQKESREALLVDLLKTRARGTPLLIVLEDAHWLDPLSVDLLAGVARAIPALPVLILLAYRPPDPVDSGSALPDPSGVPQSTIERLPHFTVIGLPRLTDEEAAAHITARLGLDDGGQTSEQRATRSDGATELPPA